MSLIYAIFYVFACFYFKQLVNFLQFVQKTVRLFVLYGPNKSI